MAIMAVRKSVPTPTKRPTKATREAVQFELELARVQRPGLTDWILSGGFHNSPAVPANVVRDPALFRRDHAGDGYVLTDADKGRAKGSEKSIAESVRIWIDRYFVATGAIGPDEIAVVIVPD